MTTGRFKRSRCLILIGLFVCSIAAAPNVSASSPTVTVMRTPGGGIQPQAVVDDQGILHLIYFVGDPAHGDIFYVRKSLGRDEPFSSPIRVNSEPGSAIAIGTIRGAQIAIGRNGRVHVAWNGSDQAARGPGGTPMLYARLRPDGTTFEPERDLITTPSVAGLDGGGSVAADTQGDVYVTWHAAPQGEREDQGVVFLARSTDDGQTFFTPKRINAQATGACGCCSMRAFADSRGTLYVLYRTAAQFIHRDTTLLVSQDQGRTFQTSTLQPWQIDACPMSSFSMSEGHDAVLGAWETQGQVYFAALGRAQSPVSPMAPSGEGRRKYPIAIQNAQGQTLLVWSDGSGWQRGGTLAWQLFDPNGRPAGARGLVKDGVPVWSLPTAVARPDGTFLVVE